MKIPTRDLTGVTLAVEETDEDDDYMKMKLSCNKSYLVIKVIYL